MTYGADASQCAAALRHEFEMSATPEISALKELVQHFGASITNLTSSALQGSFTPAAGCLPGSWQVSINSTMPSRRYRFALAHELGHLYVRHNNFTPSAEERWCNQFAAELLMPASYVQREYRNADASLATVRDVARRYDVSRSAALVRLRHVLKWERGLIGLQLRGDTWFVVQMTAIPAVALYQLVPASREADIPRRAQIFQSWLRFGFHREQIEILSECLRRGTWVDVLINSSDLEEACLHIVRTHS